MKRRSKTPGISRIDQPSHRTHGFFVRVARKGKIYPAFFTDKKYGSRKKALAAAQAHHKMLVAKLGPSPMKSRRVWAEMPRRKSKSGIVGVRRAIVRVPGKKLRKYWTVTWSPKRGVVKRRQFSIRKHGEAKARRLAIRARRAGVRSMKP